MPDTMTVPTGSEPTEKALLGACLVSDKACEESCEHLDPADFSNAGWAACFAVIQEMYKAGESPEVPAIIEEMRANGTLELAGGENGILSLLAQDTIANVRSPIRIILDYSTRRRVKALGLSLVNMAGDPAQQISDIVGHLSKQAKEVELPASTGEAIPLRTLLDAQEDPYDWVVPNLIERQDRTIVVAPEGKGKALALDTPIPTASGTWTDMESVQAGDRVLGPGYTVRTVVATSDVMYNRGVAAVMFEDGTEVVADLDHQWMVYGVWGERRHRRTWKVVNTWQVLEKMKSGICRLFVPGADPDSTVRITGVEIAPSVPVRCIQVDHPDGLFLAGKGKVATHNSTLLRQVAVMIAAGLHPFHPTQRIRPMRTLIVDLENRERAVRRAIGPLADQATYNTRSDTWSTERCHIWASPGGVDLRDRNDLGRLMNTIRQVDPDLVTIGPIYKMTSGDPRDEEVAKQLADILEHITVRYDCSLLMEAHAPHGSGGKDNREMRPFGASLWQRWPEFGLGMYPQPDGGMEIRHWRGQREERDWPAYLARGHQWPWVASEDGLTADEY